MAVAITVESFGSPLWSAWRQ